MKQENNQKGRILSDLLEGKEINMLENLQRYKIYYMAKDEIERHKKGA